MEAIECIKTRRSVRAFTSQPIEHDTIRKIVDAAIYAPSWKNSQTIRYIVVEDRKKIDAVASQGVLGFSFNANTLRRCAALAVQTVVTGICGYDSDGAYSTSKGNGWEMYDAGISGQTFCLAAHAYNVKTVIMGLIDDEKIREILNIPPEETVTALIAMGYSDLKNEPPKRKSVDEILRFV